MRRIAAISVVCAAAVAAVVLGTGASGGSGGTYEVRAVFDNVAGAVPGMDVRVAGATVGAIGEMDVTRDNKAAVVLSVEEPGFSPFHADARCRIRPQSLIGEKYVECDPGSPEAPPLREIPDGEEGAGQHELPIDRTSSPVDIDLINNVMRLPYRQRLALVINEFGTGLAGRGEDLNEVIHRANPALRETTEVLKVLAGQNRVIARLAEDSDTVLQPLARERERVGSFVDEAAATAEATAERREDMAATFERLPRFLEELEPTMRDLGVLSDEMTPVVRDLGAAAPDLTRFVLALGPFSRQSVPSLDTLGDALQVGGPALRRSEPLLEDLHAFGRDAGPVSRDLRAFLTSFDETGGIERLMDYLFFQVTAINGYDSLSHYLRAGLIASAACSFYSTEVALGCESTFGRSQVRGSSAAADDAEAPEQASGGATARRPPVGAGDAPLGGVKNFLPLEDPAARAQREARIEQFRKDVETGPARPYGEPEPFMDYLLGNDG